MAKPRLCSIPDCGKPARPRGFCEMHYQRWKKHGDPHTVLVTPAGEPERFIREVAIPYTGDDCLKWPYSNNGNGYGRLKLDGRLQYVHRFVCAQVYGPPADAALVAAHSCGNGKGGCINPRHLRWATQAENMADTLDHGTRAIGTRCGSSKLDEAAVRRIRKLAAKMRTDDIAAMYGMERHAIRKVITRETWGHVNDA